MKFKEFAKSPQKQIDMFPLDNIKKSDLRSSPGATELKRDKNRVSKLIQNVWSNQTIFDEKLNDIVGKIDPNASIAEYFEKLEKCGANLMVMIFKYDYSFKTNPP